MKHEYARALFLFLLFMRVWNAQAEGINTATGKDGTADSSEENLPPGLNAEAALLARLSGLFIIEDPTSVYQMDVYDESVEFLLDGSWTAGFEGSLDFTTADGVTTVSVTPPVFTQAVNLSAWIFISGRWYFQADFAEEFTKNTLAFGYVGGESEPVKHVRIGNSGILFPNAYPFIALGGADREALSPVIAPGAMGTFSGKSWRADAMVRYDAASARELILSGMNEAADTTASITDPVRRTWFTLPDAPVTGAVTVWAEDPSGTITDSAGRTWRRLKDAEFQADGLSGTVQLAKAAAGAVAVSYSSLTAAAVQAFTSDVRAWFNDTAGISTGDAAHSYLITLNGTDAVLLAETGRFSPFENLSRYALSGDSIQIVHEESGTLETGYETAAVDDDHTELGNPALPAARGERDPAGRYPLADRFPAIYLPPFTPGSGATDLALRSRTYTPVTEISLGDKAIPGTIVMTRNGVTDTGFTFDQSSGILTPDRMPGLTDSIRITWLDEDSSARNAAFTAALGGALFPLPGLELKAASALRWNLSGSGFTDSSEGSPGSWVNSAGISWKKGDFTASTAGAFTITVSDTTGLYRIEGMDSASAVFYPAKDWYRKAPGYEDTSISTLTADNISGTILHMEGTLTEDASAAAADILVGEFGSADIRNASAISVTLRNPGARSDYQLVLQGGAPDTGYTLTDTEAAEWVLETPAAGSAWQTQTVTITEADRLLLGGWQNLRILARPVSGTPLTDYPIDVEIETGPITIVDGGFTVTAEPTGGNHTAVPESSGTLVSSLEAHSSTIINRVNPGGANTLMKLTLKPDTDVLDNTIDDQTVSISRYLAPVPLDTYKTLSFELYPDNLKALSNAADVLVKLSFLSPEESGSETTALELTLPASELATEEWRTIKADLATRSVTADGAALTGAELTHNTRADLPTILRLSVEIPEGTTVPAGGWSIAFDEVRLTETETVRSVVNETELAWSRQGRIAGIGKATLLANPDLSIKSRLSNNLETGENSLSGSADAGLTVTGIRTEISAAASTEAEGVLENVAHKVSVPLGILNLTETMAADFAGSSLSRSESVSLSGPVPITGRSTLSLGSSSLTRENTVSLAPVIPLGKAGSLGLYADGKAAQNGSSPWDSLSDREWTEVWSDSFSLMTSDGEEDAKKRSLNGAARLSWKPVEGLSSEDGGVLGITAGTNLAETYTLGTSGLAKRNTAAGYDFALPFRLLGSTFTPTWKRSALRRRDVGAGGTWTSDAEALGSSLKHLSWLVETPPAADLFTEAPEGSSDDESSFSYQTAYGLDWDRPAPGRLSDLWLPVSAGASIARESSVETLGASRSDTRSASARLFFSALNIAGAYGIKPVFTWYEQDELSQSYSWTAEWGAGYFSWTIDAWDGLSLYWGDAGSFSIDNGIAYSSAEVDGSGESLGGTFRAAWRRRSKNEPVAALIRCFTDLKLEQSREDSLSWSWHALDDPTMNAEYNHRLITKVGANGEISISGGITYSAAEATATAGIRLSAGGTLRY